MDFKAKPRNKILQPQELSSEHFYRYSQDTGVRVDVSLFARCGFGSGGVRNGTASLQVESINHGFSESLEFRGPVVTH